jgi:DNA-binding XRE family transcriptional regulator
VDAWFSRCRQKAVNRIKSYRQGFGWTLEQLAEKVGSSKAYMWQLENKDDPDPGVKLSIKLAQAFGVSVEHLFR